VGAVPRRNVQVREGRPAFLKKSSKKLLIILASACPDRQKPSSAKVFWFFFFKKERLSGTWPRLAFGSPAHSNAAPSSKTICSTDGL
jgi:hypothetical protein